MTKPLIELDAAIALKPCPFCGGKAKRGTYDLWCDGTTYNRHTMIVLKEEEWNTRALPLVKQEHFAMQNTVTADPLGACIMQERAANSLYNMPTVMSENVGVVFVDRQVTRETILAITPSTPSSDDLLYGAHHHEPS